MPSKSVTHEETPVLPRYPHTEPTAAAIGKHDRPPPSKNRCGFAAATSAMFLKNKVREELSVLFLFICNTIWDLPVLSKEQTNYRHSAVAQSQHLDATNCKVLGLECSSGKRSPRQAGHKGKRLPSDTQASSVSSCCPCFLLPSQALPWQKPQMRWGAVSEVLSWSGLSLGTCL